MLHSQRFGYVSFLLVLWGFLLPSALPAQSSADSSGTVTVRVEGLSSDDGRVQIALTDAEGYENDEDLREAALPITNGRARWTVEAVPFGTYAVQLYHDENANGDLGTNLMGMPTEAYGFSNDARGRFGPPDFEEAAFTLDTDSLSQTITAQ